jgi:hypothetical protein
MPRLSVIECRVVQRRQFASSRAFPRALTGIPKTFRAFPQPIRACPFAFSACPHASSAFPHPLSACPCALGERPQTFGDLPQTFGDVPQALRECPAALRVFPQTFTGVKNGCSTGTAAGKSYLCIHVISTMVFMVISDRSASSPVGRRQGLSGPLAACPAGRGVRLEPSHRLGRYSRWSIPAGQFSGRKAPNS